MNARKAPGFALLLAVIMLIVGVPIVAIPVSADQGPALVLDICHPAQALVASAAPCELPLPSTAVQEQALRYFGPAPSEANPAPMRATDPPEPPPPEF